MPTGYTADVEDGKITTLEEYALKCARAFGACVTMRDMDLSIPAPKKIEPDTEYYDNRLKEAKKEFKKLQKMNDKQVAVMAAIEYKSELKSSKESHAERKIQYDRYVKMKELVQVWEVCAELSGLKAFMLSQLNDSMKWAEPEEYAPPRELTGSEWHARELKRARESIEYAAKHIEDEIERTKSRNEWLALLHSALSVPAPKKRKTK